MCSLPCLFRELIWSQPLELQISQVCVVRFGRQTQKTDQETDQEASLYLFSSRYRPLDSSSYSLHFSAHMHAVSHMQTVSHIDDGILTPSISCKPVLRLILDGRSCPLRLFPPS